MNVQPLPHTVAGSPEQQVLELSRALHAAQLQLEEQTRLRARAEVEVRRLQVEHGARNTERLEALRRSEREFRSTFERAAVGIAHVGLDGRLLRVNPRLCEISGYAESELLGMSAAQLAHLDELAQGMGDVRRLLDGEVASLSLEHRLIHRSGAIRWTQVTCSVVREDDGTAGYLIVFVEDISTRKQAELALQQSERNLRLAITAGGLGTWSWEIGSGRL